MYKNRKKEYINLVLISIEAQTSPSGRTTGLVSGSAAKFLVELRQASIFVHGPCDTDVGDLVECQIS
jgi:hypothetical protein